MVYDEEFNGRIFVPSNIKQNKQFVIARFDLREVFFIFIAIVIFLVLLLVLSRFISNTMALAIALIFSAPILFAGFAKFDGLKIEEYLIVMRANKMLSNKVRINNSDNIYEIYEKDTKKKEKINKKSKIKQTSTQEQKHKKKKITKEKKRGIFSFIGNKNK